jgi:hypothetical protein
MVQRVSTVAFEGIDARAVDVQVQVAPGLPAFKIVGCQWEKGLRLAMAKPSSVPTIPPVANADADLDQLAKLAREIGHGDVFEEWVASQGRAWPMDQKPKK